MSQQQRLSVLVVDQDPEAQYQLKETLSAEGYQVSVLGDPALVGQEVRENRYQLVILDVSPGSGIDALDAIRKVDSDLCVIATTALPSVEVAVATMKRQAYHYLQKPLDQDELREVLNAAIREKGLLVDLETRLNSAVGQRIREQRHSRPLTLKQLANRTGLSVSLISQIELGKSAASMATLHKLAAALGVKMTYFFETV